MKFLFICVLISVANANVIGNDFAGRLFNAINATVTDNFALRVLSVRDHLTLKAHLSSGVAISENYGLVVAQAIKGFYFWYIQYGSIHVDELSIQSITGKNVKVHPDYNPDTLQNNIAVIKFSTPVSRFVPLAPQPIAFPIFFIFGFGFVDVDNAVLSQSLQNLIIMQSFNECEQFYAAFDQDNSICGNFPTHSRITDGNQGGPVTDIYRNFLLGIISYWGNGTYPLVAIDVLSYRNFIDTSILEFMWEWVIVK